MTTLVISSNPLFVEALSETLTERLEAPLLSVQPEGALERIQVEHPEVLLVDDSVAPGLLMKILKQAQRLAKTRLILLDSTCNDFIILDSIQATIGNVDDLVDFIRMKNIGNGKAPSNPEIQAKDPPHPTRPR